MVPKTPKPLGWSDKIKLMSAEYKTQLILELDPVISTITIAEPQINAFRPSKIKTSSQSIQRYYQDETEELQPLSESQ